ncbi:MAG: hypothetical protein JWR07_5544 [Nevskia sp.]|nr:hypothetical protein [Nevskia sp.]
MLLRQMGDRSAELRWDDVPLLPPIRLSAGRHAVRSVTLVAEAESRWQFRIAAKSSGYAAEYELSLGRTHPASAEDRIRRDAEIDLARADDLRLASGSSENGGKGGNAAVATAASAYEEAIAAWRKAGDGCGLRQAFAGLARLRFAHGDYSSTLAAGQGALRQACGRDADPAGQADLAEVSRTLGAALNYQGDFESAIAMQKQALGLYEKTGDQRFQEVVLGNLSDDYAQTGQLGKALEGAQSALRTAQSLDDRQGVEFGRERVATLLFTRGELNAAMAGYLATLDELKATPYPLVENMAQNDLGRLYRVLGDLPRARHAYEAAEAVAQANEDHAAVAEALRNQADIALDANQVQAAADLFSKALDQARAGGYRSVQADSLRGLARCALGQGLWEQSHRLLKQASALAIRDGDVVVQMQVGLTGGDLESARRHWKEARAEYARVYSQARRAQITDVQPVALASLARATQAAGEPQHAMHDAERAIDLIESQRTSIDNPAFRTSYLSSRRAYYALYIDILMDLERRQPGHGYAGLALEASERARARGLQDMLLERQLAVDPHVEAGLFAEERGLEDRLNLLAFQRRRLSAHGDERGRQRLKDAIDEASGELDQVRGRIRAANPRYAELINPPRLGLPEMQQRLLDPQAALLEYWLGERRSYLWLVQSGRLKVFTLPPRQQIEAATQPLLTQLAAQLEPVEGLAMDERASWEAARLQSIHALVQVLQQEVLAPVRQSLGSGAVVIVADGVLAQVPFGLLDAGDSPDTPAGAVHDFTYLPSLQTVRWLRGVKRRERPQGVAVMADPVLAQGDERLHEAAAGDNHGAAGAGPIAADALRPGELRRLRYSRQEAERIAALAAPQPAWLALDFAASRRAALQAHWPDYAIVHFATHALIDQQHPDLSGIALSQYDRDGKAQDGLLSMNDIYNLDLPAELVVLSACESAGGPLGGEEGVFSLSRAFFYAGTRRVLGSLWPVDDRASAHFMERFYTALMQQKQPPAAALRQAQRQMAQDPDWQSPYYWAGYVLQGDWR